jgi:hypothetical protein
MPIWLRKFTFNKLKEWYDKQNEDTQPPTKPSTAIARPNIKPAYSTKASK